LLIPSFVIDTMIHDRTIKLLYIYATKRIPHQILVKICKLHFNLITY
jgi:hypothetical protein